MATVISITGTRQAIRENKKRQKKYKMAVQHSLALYMDLVRTTAARDFIIDNTTGFLNPFMARKVQPAHPTKLTSRTGKLRWALREKASKDPTREWKGFGRKTVKLDTAALKLLVRVVESGGADSYLGTMRISINYLTGPLTSVGTAPTFDDAGKEKTKGFKPKWMPRETKQTIRARFFHELGIRGRRRQFIDPAARMVLRKLDNVIDTRIGKIWR